MFAMFRSCCLLVLLLLLPLTCHAGLGANELAVVVNDNDPLSREVAEYYVAARGIPVRHLIHMKLPANAVSLTAAEFQPIRAAILAATPAQVQAYALTWTQPYRVDCMSITSALSFGFDPAWCSRGKGCSLSRDSPLFNYNTGKPFSDLGIRPSMMIAATNFADARALIDRGVRADAGRPHGGAYLMVTSDRDRSTPRLPAYLKVLRLRVPGLGAQLIRAEVPPRRSDVLFFFTGLPEVNRLDALHFLPGAVADHLTSFGGMLTDSPQMSALRWLQAGATGSYGTVREPCAFKQKFPDPAVLIRRYTQGDTLIEAYWKSVSSPGEGVFIGEPLSRPWGPAAQTGPVTQ